MMTPFESINSFRLIFPIFRVLLYFKVTLIPLLIADQQTLTFVHRCSQH